MDGSRNNNNNDNKDNDFRTLGPNEDEQDNVSGQYDNNGATDDEMLGLPPTDYDDVCVDITGGPISGRSNSSGKHRYLKRSESHPYEGCNDDDDGDNDAIDGYKSKTRTSRSDTGMEMRNLGDRRRNGDHRGSSGRSSDKSGSNNNNIMRHRRAKSQHVSGYSYYKKLQRTQQQQVTNDGFQSDPAYDSEPEMEEGLSLQDLKRTFQFLATIRVRSKSKKRRKSLGVAGVSNEGADPDVETALDLDGEDDVDDEDGGYVEEIGLPSARHKRKGLAYRMQMSKLDSVEAVARDYHHREHMLELSAEHKGKNVPVLRQVFRSLRNGFFFFNFYVSFWSTHFKEIEGMFGIAVTTYFRFTRWLVKVNFFVFLFFFCFLLIPKFISIANPSQELFVEETSLNTSHFNKAIFHAFECSSSYKEYLNNVTTSTWLAITFDIATGTGVLEDTFLFYGEFSNLTVTYHSTDRGGIDAFSTNFNMGLTYILTMILTFFMVFVLIVNKSSYFIQELVVGSKNNTATPISNAVFSSWDYCINSEKTAFYKQKIIYNMIQAKLEEFEMKRRLHKLTGKEQTVLYMKRGFINFLVILILGGSFASIYFATIFLLQKQEEDLSDVVAIFVEFLPSITISFLYLVVPGIFTLLAEKERYTPVTRANITILRAVFLRISLVGVLIVSLYYRLQSDETSIQKSACPEEIKANSTDKCCGNSLWNSGSKTSGNKGSVMCWETYVGQQFYKLAIADIFNVCLISLSVAGLRKFVVTKFNGTWWASLIGLYAFDLPVEVLDLVYSQTVCWIGMFFCPLLPLITLAKLMLFFFVKKFTLIRLCEPPKNVYRASSSYSFFQVVLLGAYTIICLILGYMIGNVQPSKSCGPFRVYSKQEFVMFDSFRDEINTWSDIPKGIFNYFGTVGFILPAFIVLLLAIYYYWAVSRGYKHLEEILQHQIKSEAHDKQFLLARVDEILKQNDLYDDDDEL